MTVTTEKRRNHTSNALDFLAKRIILSSKINLSLLEVQTDIDICKICGKEVPQKLQEEYDDLQGALQELGKGWRVKNGE